jgi:hypothetical protein
MTTTHGPAVAPRTALRVEFAKRHPLDDSPRVALILVPTHLVTGLSPEEVAEEVFVATNAPFDVEGLAAEVRSRIAARASSGTYFPSLSVGDYVRLGLSGPTVKVESVGFSRVAS